jgi:hypothetical protein
LSLKRQLLVSFGLQGAGAAAVLLATLLLGARLGPEVQGGFSRIKSEIEFVAAFAMFGLPQALFFYVKSGALSARSALRWALACALLALPVAGLYAVWRHAHDGVVGVVLLSLAVAAAVAHGQLRALLLVRERTAWFNVITALPQGLVLLGVLIAIGFSMTDAPTWFAVFALAAALTASISWWRLHGAPSLPVAAPAGRRAVLHYGLAAWLTAALATAAILLVQRWVEVSQGRAALGQFTMAMTLVQVPLTPISYAAPLLLRRWMERPGAAASRRVAGGVFALLLAAAGVVALAADAWPDLGLGAAYTGVTRALAVLLAGGAAEAASRVLTVHASASGLPWIGVRAEAARWAVLGLGWLALTAPSLWAVSAVWAVAAWASAGVFVWFARAEARKAAS